MATPINRSEFQTVLNNNLQRFFNFVKYRTITESLADYVYGVGVAGSHPAMSLGGEKAGLTIDAVNQVIQFEGSPIQNVLWEGVDKYGNNDIVPIVTNMINNVKGSIIFFPKGNYLIGSNWVIRNGCQILGEEGTFFIIGDVGIGIKVQSTVDNLTYKFSMNNVTINANGYGLVGGGILDIEDCIKTDLENVTVYDTGQFAPAGNKYYGIQIRRSTAIPFVHNTIRIYNCKVSSCKGGGILVHFGTKSVRIIDTFVTSCFSDGTALTLANGIDIVGAENTIVTGCTIEGNEGNGIYVSTYSGGADQFPCKNVSINNNDVQQNAISTWGTNQECAGIAWQNKYPSLKGWGNIFENRIVGNGSPFVASSGIMIIDDDDVYCHDNNIYDNTKHGIKVQNTSRCKIIQNTIIKSSTISGTDSLIEIAGGHATLSVVDNNMENGFRLSMPCIYLNATITNNSLIVDNKENYGMSYGASCKVASSTIRTKHLITTGNNVKMALPMPILVLKRMVSYKATAMAITLETAPRYSLFYGESAVCNINGANQLMTGAFETKENMIPASNGMQFRMNDTPTVFSINFNGLNVTTFWEIDVEYKVGI